jgi:hypothetical protein
VAHRAADGCQRKHLSLRRVGRQREARRGRLGHAGQAVHVRIQIRDLFLAELRERRHDAPRLLDRVKELRLRQLAAGEVGTEPALTLIRMAVLARGRVAVPQRLTRDRITGRSRGLRRGERSEHRNQQKCEQNSFHKSLTSAAHRVYRSTSRTIPGF